MRLFRLQVLWPGVQAQDKAQTLRHSSAVEKSTRQVAQRHVARPIADYSVASWRHYVAIMAPRAGLQPNDRAALEAYVVAARESLSPASASP